MFRSAFVLAFVMLAIPSRAWAAAGGEAIRLVVDAPNGCLTEGELVDEVERLGTRLRVAEEGERARRFDVRIVPEGDHVVARLTVRDLVGRETVRSVENATCAEAGRSASLLVSLAVDEESEKIPPGPPEERPYRWPQPVTREVDAPVAPPATRIGSGGIAVSAFRGWGNGRPGATLYGAKTYAAWRYGLTRIGGTVAFQRDDDTVMNTRATSGRLGAVIGWGAPWSDAIVGFLGEAGATTGAAETIELGSSRIRTVTTRYAAPYAAASLVLQLPWQYTVRPVVGLGAVWSPGGYASRLDVAFAADMGVVWQAW